MRVEPPEKKFGITRMHATTSGHCRCPAPAATPAAGRSRPTGLRPRLAELSPRAVECPRRACTTELKHRRDMVDTVLRSSDDTDCRLRCGYDQLKHRSRRSGGAVIRSSSVRGSSSVARHSPDHRLTVSGKPDVFQFGAHPRMAATSDFFFTAGAHLSRAYTASFPVFLPAPCTAEKGGGRSSTFFSPATSATWFRSGRYTYLFDCEANHRRHYLCGRRERASQVHRRRPCHRQGHGRGGGSGAGS